MKQKSSQGSFHTLLEDTDTFCTLDLLPLYYFVTVCVGHLEKTGSLSSGDFPDVDMFQ